MNAQTLLITGASYGLGAAAARIAARAGARVALMARSADELGALAREIEAAGGQALALPGDVSRPDDCRNAVARTLDRFGRLDALVNNAGVIQPIAPIVEADPEAWQTHWAINVLGPVMLTQAALPALRESGGRVVNVSSSRANKPTPGWGAYCASKAALNHFTRVLASEEPALTALALNPGAIDTPMQELIRREGAAGMPPEDYQRVVRWYEEKTLLPPDVSGRALIALALYAPRDWSGEFIAWDDARVQALVAEHGLAQG